MIDERLTEARTGDEAAFRELVGPYRRELQLHCYRFLGSVQDAEDLVQETLLAFVTAMQHLQPRQRATLLLRDVLGFRAAEVAEMLGTSEDSVNGALDVRLTMPPEPYGWYGRDAVAGFLSHRFSLDRHRLVPTQANSQLAFGLYLKDVHSAIAHAHGLLVLTIQGGRISAITRFMDNSVMARFGLPRTLPD